MADQLDWGTEANVPVKPPRRVPTWAWFCGGGCLLALIVMVALAIAVFSWGKEMADPDKQWREVEQVLTVEKRPEGEIFGMKVPFQDLRVISLQQGGTKIDFMIAGGAQGEELREQFLDPSAEMNFGPLLGNMGRYEPQEVTLSVQGCELKGMRFITQPRSAESETEVPLDENGDPRDLEFSEATKLAMRQSTVALDISPEGGTKVVILQYSHMGTLETIEDSEVIEFLAHFKLGGGN